jgi:uncharacterized protein (TIGR02996 family)
VNRHAFLSAICAEPNEMVHRLVYADWLDEHGEAARAEFIRLQVRRDGLPAEHPLVRWSISREAELLEVHGVTWLADLPPGLERPRWHRGFVEEIRTSPAQWVLRHTEIREKTPICRLRLTTLQQVSELVDAQPERLAASLAGIEHLDLNDDPLTDGIGAAFLDLPEFPRLKSLYLRRQHLSPAGLEVLGTSGLLTSLDTLEIGFGGTTMNALSDLEPLLYSPELGKLRSLRLRGSLGGFNYFTWINPPLLAASLERLCLSHCQLRAQELDRILVISLPRLQALDLSFNAMGPEAVKAVDALQDCPLSWLNLSRTLLGDDGATQLANSPFFTQLHGLDLSLNRIGSAGGRALAQSDKLTAIQMLDLIYNHFDEATEEALVARYGKALWLDR